MLLHFHSFTFTWESQHLPETLLFSRKLFVSLQNIQTPQETLHSLTKYSKLLQANTKFH